MIKVVAKKVMVTLVAVATVATLNGASVSAATILSRSVTTGDYNYTITASTGSAPKSIKLYDILYHTKVAAVEELSIEVGKSTTSTQTEGINAALSATVGSEIKLFGQNAKAEISSSISTASQTQKSVSKTYKKGYKCVINQSQKKGYYALEAVTCGKSITITFAKTNIKKANNRKVSTEKIVYRPNEDSMPAKRVMRYDSDPQCLGIYTKY